LGNYYAPGNDKARSLFLISTVTLTCPGSGPLYSETVPLPGPPVGIYSLRCILQSQTQLTSVLSAVISGNTTTTVTLQYSVSSAIPFSATLFLYALQL
jgi:hypothetical protein